KTVWGGSAPGTSCSPRASSVALVRCSSASRQTESDAHYGLRCRTSRRVAERAGDAGACDACAARQPPRGRGRAARRGSELRPSRRGPANGGRGGGRRGDRAPSRHRVLRSRAQRARLRAPRRVPPPPPQLPAPAAAERCNQRTGNRSPSEAEDAATVVLDRSELPVTLTISVAFGCPFEGRVDHGVVTAIAERFAARAEIVLADTIGVATPSQVR